MINCCSKNISVLCIKIAIGLFIGLTSHVKAHAQVWWSPDYDSRQNIELTTGSNTPDKGYNGYTVRLNNIDTAAWIASGNMRADCNDLRIVFWNGSTNIELPRHVINCNSANTDIRFKMLSNQAATSTTTSDYFIYYGNAVAPAAEALSTDNVYIWYDDGAVNRLASYEYGRFDDWAGTGFYEDTSYNIAGYYQYNTGDNFTFGMRQNVDERDVYIEMETFHQRCYPLNISVGPIVRTITTGSGASESSNHYYGGISGHQNGTGCTLTGGYDWDGDINQGVLDAIAVNGPNPAALTSNQWRKTALASWSINPTNLSYSIEDDANNWDALGYPSSSNLHISGTDVTDSEGRGEAGYAATQDQGRIRNMLIRRYVEPEPILTLASGLLNANKTVSVYDPGSQGLYAIPGTDVIYTINISNEGQGSVDFNSIDLIDIVPGNVEFYNGDIDDGGPETNPVAFAQSGVTGITFTYTSDVAFSNASIKPTDFSACGYTPVIGYDPQVKYICFNPKGTMVSDTPDPMISVSFRARIK